MFLRMGQSKDKGRENSVRESLSSESSQTISQTSPLKSFKTSEEISLECNSRFTILGKDYHKIKNKLWLSKEDYEKRVEEFRREIASGKWLKVRDGNRLRDCFSIEEIDDLINKILLGK